MSYIGHQGNLFFTMFIYLYIYQNQLQLDMMLEVGMEPIG